MLNCPIQLRVLELFFPKASNTITEVKNNKKIPGMNLFNKLTSTNYRDGGRSENLRGRVVMWWAH